MSLTPRVYGLRAGLNESFQSSAIAIDPPPFAMAVKVAAKQTVEIEVPVGTGTNFGLTLMADPSVSQP